MVLIIVPTFNEEKKIGRVVRGLFEQGYKNILVVDDASKDNTVGVALKNGAIVLSHKINRGQGAALETGNAYARQHEFDIVVHFDGDDQMNPEDILFGLNLINKNECDVVLGSRFLDKRSKIPFFKKNLILPVSRWINFVFTHVKLTDAHNGFRILNFKALNSIVITQDKMAHNTEIVRAIKKNGLKFAEVPVEIRYHEFGQGVSGGFKILWDLIINI